MIRLCIFTNCDEIFGLVERDVYRKVKILCGDSFCGQGKRELLLYSSRDGGAPCSWPKGSLVRVERRRPRSWSIICMITIRLVSATQC